jgi:hypothetical protein
MQAALQPYVDSSLSKTINVPEDHPFAEFKDIYRLAFEQGNEAAMAAAREGAIVVTPGHLDQMRDKLMMGSVRTLAIQPEEHRRLAVHEAGHTTVAHFLPHADPL